MSSSATEVYYTRHQQRFRKAHIPGDLKNGRYIDDKNGKDRFASCVVLYMGMPYVACYCGGMRVDLYEMTLPWSTSGGPKSAATRVSINDPDLETNLNEDVGFINLDYTTLFCTRLPARRQTVGITSENTSVMSLTDPEMAYALDYDKLFTKELAAAVLNQYPSFSETLTAVQKKPGPYTDYSARAFSKRIALFKKGAEPVSVFYMTDRVGTIPNTEEPFVKLEPEFKDSVLRMQLRAVGLDSN